MLPRVGPTTDLDPIVYLTRYSILPRAFGSANGIRLLKRHGCSEQGGSYVNYPVFVASFAAAVRDAEHASVVAAVAAANATAAVASASVAAPAAKGSSGMVSGMMPAKYNQGSGGPVR